MGCRCPGRCRRLATQRQQRPERLFRCKILPQPAAATVHSVRDSGGGVADAAEAAMAKQLPGNDGAKVLGKRRKEPDVPTQLRTYLLPLCTGMLAAKANTGLTQGRVERQLRIHAEQYQRLAQAAAASAAADLAGQFRDLAGAIPGTYDEFVALYSATNSHVPRAGVAIPNAVRLRRLRPVPLPIPMRARQCHRVAHEPILITVGQPAVVKAHNRPLCVR
jgi:hypothetical protein